MSERVSIVKRIFELFPTCTSSDDRILLFVHKYKLFAILLEVLLLQLS